MGEVLAVAASALGVIGFAGQILQGCQSVVAFLDQIREAPDDFRYFRTEVKIFQSILESYRATLYEIDDSTNRDVWEHAMLVLDHCNETVDGLQRLIEKHGQRRVAKWKSLELVFQTTKLQRHLQKMDRAKGSIIAARTNATFLQGHRILGHVQDAKSRRMWLSKDLSAMQDQLHDLRVSSQETKDAMADLTDTISTRMDYLLIGLKDTVESSVRRALMDFSGVPKRQAASENFDTLPATISLNYHSIRTTHQILDLKYSVLERSVVGRRCHQRVFNTWFGVVAIHTTTTNFVEITTSKGLKSPSRITYSSQTSVMVSFMPSFIRFGMYCSIMRQNIGSAQPGADMKLRIYNVVQKSSPIVLACDGGDIAKMQMLFMTGQASPFDQLDGGMSLLDLVLLKMTVLPMRREPSKALQMMEDLCRMFEFLIDQSLDPGQLWAYSKSGISPLPFLAVFASFAPSEFTPLLLDLVRAIIQHSIQDPYYQADFTGILSYRKSVLPNQPLGPVISAIVNPEHWDVDNCLAPERDKSRKEPKSGPPVTLDIMGLSIKTWFGYSLDPREAVAALTSYYFNLQKIIHSKDAAKAYEPFLCRYLVMCIEAGLDPLLRGVDHSLVSCLRHGSQLHVLRSALMHLKWNEDEIRNLFEADLFASLAYQLANLHVKDLWSREYRISLEYYHVAPEDWEVYVQHLSSSSLKDAGISLEPLEIKCQQNSFAGLDGTRQSIGSILQTSINACKEFLGFLI